MPHNGLPTSSTDSDIGPNNCFFVVDPAHSHLKTDLAMIRRITRKVVLPRRGSLRNVGVAFHAGCLAESDAGSNFNRGKTRCPSRTGIRILGDITPAEILQHAWNGR